MRTSSVGHNALDETWAEVRAELVRFVRRRVRGPEVAEDLVQTVLERFQRTGPDTVTNPQAWLFRSARNAVIDHYRTNRAHEPFEPDTDIIDPGPTGSEPGRAVQELAGCLRPLIARLPDKYREALTLVDLEGRTQRAAAEDQGVSVSAMKSRVQRGRGQLAHLLGQCCDITLTRSGEIDAYMPHTHCPCGLNG